MSNTLGLCRCFIRTTSKLRFRMDTSFKLVKRMCKYNTCIAKSPERNIHKYCFVVDYRNDKRVF